MQKQQSTLSIAFLVASLSLNVAFIVGLQTPVKIESKSIIVSNMSSRLSIANYAFEPPGNGQPKPHNTKGGAFRV